MRVELADIERFLQASPLRQYQIIAVMALFEYFFYRSGNPLVAMPTGTGKSLVIAWFIRAMHHFYPHTRVMMLTHVKKLIQQNFGKLLEHWPTAPAGIYSAGLKRKEHMFPITFGGIQSIANAHDIFAVPDILVIDEAHLVSHKDETMYRVVIAAMQARNPNLRVMGLSATCYRMGLGSLTEGGIFTDVCVDMTTIQWFTWFVNMGFLAPLHAVDTVYKIDASQARIIGNEYVASDLENIVDTPDVIQQALRETCESAKDRNRWLMFTPGIGSCDHVAQQLNSWGIPTVAVHSKLRTDLHDDNFRDFVEGRVRCAVNVNELTTGVDVPEIDYIGCMAHTRSTSRWVQELGRGTRPAPWAGKRDCLVGDYTTNSRDLGPINDPVLPRPPRERKGGGGGLGPSPQRACPGCRSWVHASIGTCPFCGHYFAPPMNILGQSAGLEVMRLDDPVVERIPVITVTYDIHHKRDRPDSMVVTYYCQGEEGGDIPRRFKEFICLEHPGNAKNKARNWWRERCPDIEPPDTVQRAIDLSKRLRIPKGVNVWVNKSLPEIMGYEYT